MNIYVVTEGKVEKKVYRAWIPKVNSSLTPIEAVEDVTDNNFYIFSAQGYPDIFNAIDNALEDISNFPAYTRLVISVDSEQQTREERFAEFASYVEHKVNTLDVRIVIQHFCIETWALGNQQIIRRQPTIPKLV